MPKIAIQSALVFDGEAPPARTRPAARRRSSSWRETPSGAAPGSIHGALFSRVAGRDVCVHGENEVPGFMAARVAEGCEYVKVVVDDPGHSQAVLNKLAEVAREHGKNSVAHAAQYRAFEGALSASFDAITHVPMEHPVDDEMSSIWPGNPSPSSRQWS
ncbi:hypothetical protein DL766_008008 [Monosporascus sp. MC13-8B]|uniref:Gfo/Idh/MocA-like oxidoreductase N-terminal domain-containing protein n=1 Tax=Monosporascus cannonballus TaxID=155416 RepID=A0ABY0HAC3_9PEZI|nr:hypothetical protein DL762_003915 [Monosporascus cannonballus]RYP21082.1 hypothetical protein DL766_008008 [Monosporascus sp. MC13-8B]